MLRAHMGLEEQIGGKLRLVALYMQRRAIRELDQAMLSEARDYHLAHRHAVRAARIRRDREQRAAPEPDVP